jgi:hypothetical protein
MADDVTLFVAPLKQHIQYITLIFHGFEESLAFALTSKELSR